MGARRLQLIQYHFEDSGCFLEHLIIPKSYDSIPLAIDLRSTTGIVRNLLLMLTPIKFDH